MLREVAWSVGLNQEVIGRGNLRQNPPDMSPSLGTTHAHALGPFAVAAMGASRVTCQKVERVALTPAGVGFPRLWRPSAAHHNRRCCEKRKPADLRRVERAAQTPAGV